MLLEKMVFQLRKLFLISFLFLSGCSSTEETYVAEIEYLRLFRYSIIQVVKVDSLKTELYYLQLELARCRDMHQYLWNKQLNDSTHIKN